MSGFVKAVGSFVGMVAAGYLVVVLLFPPPAQTKEQNDLATGRSAAVRLSDQASLLAGGRKAETEPRGGSEDFRY